jgi:hypothetical protein
MFPVKPKKAPFSDIVSNLKRKCGLNMEHCLEAPFLSIKAKNGVGNNSLKLHCFTSFFPQACA